MSVYAWVLHRATRGYPWAKDQKLTVPDYGSFFGWPILTQRVKVTICRMTRRVYSFEADSVCHGGRMADGPRVWVDTRLDASTSLARRVSRRSAS